MMARISLPRSMFIGTKREVGWAWALPKALNPTGDAHPESMSTFGTNEHLRDR
jgi:hypothetical protein